MKTTQTKISDELVATLFATAEMCGGVKLSEAAGALFMRDLAAYPETSVLLSLARCRREVKGRLTLADIVERIDDGRPSADEAWAQVGTADESKTIVTTEEAMQALADVRRLLCEEDDTQAARMAFRASYTRIVQRNKDDRTPVRWTASLGHDRGGRAPALAEAVERGRITLEYAERKLGEPLPVALLPPGVHAKALPGASRKQLTGRSMTDADRAELERLSRAKQLTRSELARLRALQDLQAADIERRKPTPEQAEANKRGIAEVLAALSGKAQYEDKPVPR